VGEPIITIVQGETLRLRVTVRNKRTGAPIDLTGAAITGDVRKAFNGASLKAFTIEPGVLAEGVFRLLLDKTASEAIPSGDHVFQARIETADGTVKKRPRGKFIVLPG